MTNKRIGEILIDHFSVDKKEIEKALKLLQRFDGRLGEILLNSGVVSEEQISEALSLQFNIPKIDVLVKDFSGLPFKPLMDVDPSWFVKNEAIPLFDEKGKMYFAIKDPLAIYPLEVIEEIYGDHEVSLVLADERKFRELLNYFSIKHLSSEKHEFGEDEIERLRDLAGEAPIIKFVNSMISRAAEFRASDIHLENHDNVLKIRYRIDGVLQDIDFVSREVASAIISRVKIISELDIGEKRLPQDGRVQLKVSGKLFDIRVSTLPTIYGENIVLRLLEKENISYDIDTLGLLGEDEKKIEKYISHNFGLVLLTGPTGSGKSTTLYSLLNKMNMTEKKIITVEDPVEYQIKGITQIQVHEQIGLSFATILRNILRQDPDIIMIGEIRDRETAEIAIHAALTGHLVLATLHTNDSVSAITRLIDMGIEDYLINSSLIGVIAQRLARRICPKCAVDTELEAKLFDKDSLKLLKTKFNVNRLQIRKGKGCDHCASTGYRGRIGIFEVLEFSEDLKSALLKSKDYDFLRDIALNKKLKTLRDDALVKYMRGITSFKEVFRVT
jgi:type II secretory ATPase GspE/PulE/Tfp pilus assembly ATPase PilB-like protein